MSKRILILSKYYPYYPEFLQNEAPILESNFDEVSVFCLGNKYRKITQYIGNKFKVFHKRMETNNNFFHLVKYLIIGFFSKKDSLAKKEIQSSKNKNRFYAIYEYGLACQEYKFIFKEVKKYNLDDKIFVYSFWFKDTAIAAALLKEKMRMKGFHNLFFYSRAHGYDLYSERSKYGAVFQKYCLDKLDYLFPCSKAGELYLKNKYEIYSNKIVCSYLGVVNGFEPIWKDEKDEFVVATCSNVNNIKRLDLLVDELNMLKTMINVPIKWLCIGNGESLKTLKKIASNQNFEFVSFGGLNNKQVFDLYSKIKIDCFINVSSSEGLPVSIMEAQSFGIVSFATDVGGTSEIVDESRTGFLIRKDFSKGELAKKIFDYYKMTKEEKKAIYDNCIKNYHDFFDAKINYTNLLKFVIYNMEGKDE